MAAVCQERIWTVPGGMLTLQLFLTFGMNTDMDCLSVAGRMSGNTL